MVVARLPRMRTDLTAGIKELEPPASPIDVAAWLLDSLETLGPAGGFHQISLSEDRPPADA